ncbi:MAG: hypothetical protein K6G83_04250 [Lachnospiraceae bacterium]|nr:hypothetical protein [Lachnospiraceae bacterium]
MTEGILLYNKEDHQKNIFFADALTKAGKKLGLQLTLVLTEEAEKNPGEFCKNAIFAVNRSRRAALAEALEKRGLRVFNAHRVCLIANDKDLTYRFLREGGISFLDYTAIPLTGKAKALENLQNIAADFGYPLVAKPAEGHGGDQVALITEESGLITYLKELSDTPYEKLLFQRVASEPGKDLRVYVLGGRILAAVLRQGENKNDIRANYSLGGKAVRHSLTPEEEKLVRSVTRILPADLTGIDMLYHEGHPVLNEIEDAVGCRMLYANTDIDVASEYMRYIADIIKQ